MSGKRQVASGLLLLAGLLIAGCKSSGGANPNTPAQPANPASSTTKPDPSPPKPNADGTIPSGTGVEREKPAAGKGNVQGRVLYNEKPAVGIEVKLSETFNRFLGGAGGETYLAKTDSNGEYLIKNVPPKLYEGLLVKVFNSDHYVFATSGILQSAKYKIEADRTFFAPDTHLFKQDLRLVTPKAGAKIAGSNIEVKWQPYPDAAYYKFSIHGDTASGAKTEFDYINKRIDGQSYVLDKPLTPGTYRCSVEAYNRNDVRLARSADDIKFTVKAEVAK